MLISGTKWCSQCVLLRLRSQFRSLSCSDCKSVISKIVGLTVVVAFTIRTNSLIGRDSVITECLAVKVHSQTFSYHEIAFDERIWKQPKDFIKFLGQ